MAPSLAEALIDALTRRRGSGSVTTPERAAAYATSLLTEWGVERAVLADDPTLDDLDVPGAFRRGGIDVLTWPTDRPTEELLGLEGPTASCGVTVPVAAAAERGTLVLAASAGQGRAIDAASAYHLAILPADRLHRHLGDALATIYGADGLPPSAVSLVSAPSRTSDIEKISTLGAHGALAIHALVVQEGGDTRT